MELCVASSTSRALNFDAALDIIFVYLISCVIRAMSQHNPRRSL